MSWWFDRDPGDGEPGARGAGRSVYEERIPDNPEPELVWVPVAELDRHSGRVIAANPDWLRHTSGWKPIEDFLSRRF